MVMLPSGAVVVVLTGLVGSGILIMAWVITSVQVIPLLLYSCPTYSAIFSTVFIKRSDCPYPVQSKWLPSSSSLPPMNFSGGAVALAPLRFFLLRPRLLGALLAAASGTSGFFSGSPMVSYARLRWSLFVSKVLRSTDDLCSVPCLDCDPVGANLCDCPSTGLQQSRITNPYPIANNELSCCVRRYNDTGELSCCV